MCLVTEYNEFLAEELHGDLRAHAGHDVIQAVQNRPADFKHDGAPHWQNF